MKKILELFKNKKFCIGFAVGLVVIIIVIVLIVNLTKTQTYQGKLERQLKEMGKDFYENYYYDQISQDESKRKEHLDKYKSIGIKIDLDNLARYNSEKNKDIVAGFVNNATNEACNKKETKVVIYPENPYGKSNYKLEVILECGFNEKEEGKK